MSAFVSSIFHRGVTEFLLPKNANDVTLTGVKTFPGGDNGAVQHILLYMIRAESNTKYHFLFAAPVDTNTRLLQVQVETYPKAPKVGRPHMTSEDKEKILDLHNQGWSYRQIGRYLHRGHHVVSNVVRKWMKEKSLDRTKGTGRKRKTSAETDMLILRIAAANKCYTAKDLKSNLGLKNICERTIRNRIREAEEKSVVGKKSS